MSTEIQTAQTNEIIASDEVRALLAQAAAAQSSAENFKIPFLSIKGKKFSLGEEKLGTSLNVVILADTFDRAYYDRAYDPDVINPPACFAIGKDEKALAPPDGVPVRQADICAHCPKNEFGSGNNGKSKACRNGRRLLLASVNGEKVNMDDLVILNLPPTSQKSYARYVKNITTIHGYPTWGVVTRLGFDDDSAWPLVTETMLNKLPESDLTAIVDKLQSFQEAVEVPYDVTAYEPLDEAEQAATQRKKSKMS